jgi:glycosyltransferase 2 family protein
MRSRFERVFPFLKLLFAAAIIGWMVRSGKLNFRQVADAVDRWPVLLLMGVLILTQIGLTAWRWRLILRAHAWSLSFRDTFSLTMIGSLFNMVIPSSVGGDVIKGYYLTRRVAHARADALATIVLDRAVGLLGLVLLASGAALGNLSMIGRHPALRILCCFAALAAALGLAFVVAVSFAPKVEGVTRRLPVLGRILAGAGAYRRRPWILPAATGISVFCHMLGCSEIYLALRALGVPYVPPGILALMAPLGFVATAIPLAPGGIGVGQAAFFSLFGIVPALDPASGANAFTVYQSILLLIYCGGFYFYLSHKKTTAEESAAAVPIPGPAR